MLIWPRDAKGCGNVVKKLFAFLGLFRFFIVSLQNIFALNRGHNILIYNKKETIHYMKKVSKSLSAHIARLTELAKRIENANGNISQIDIDILLDELRRTYDAVYHWNTAEAEQETDDKDLKADAAQAETDKADESKELQAEKPVDEVVRAAENNTEMPEEAAKTSSLAPMSVLMVDNDVEPVFAEEPEVEAVKAYDSTQPSMETLEGKPNDELFAEEEKIPQERWKKLDFLPSGELALLPGPCP